MYSFINLPVYLQETNATLQHMRRILRDMEIEHNGCSEMLRLQANHLDFKAKRQETLMRELEVKLSACCWESQQALAP